MSPMLALLLLTGLVAPRAVSAATPPEQPTTVTLHLRDVPAADAYVQLAKQSKVRIDYSWTPPDAKRRVTLTLVHEPFWVAMARVGKAGGMEIDGLRRRPEPGIALIPGSYQRNRQAVGTSVDGLFYATLFDHTSDADLRAPPDPTVPVASQLMVMLWGEPKLRTLMWHSIKVEELVDDAGREIEHKPYARAQNFHSGRSFLALALNERTLPRRIGRLRITSKVLAAATWDTAEVTDLMNGISPPVAAGGFDIETTSAPDERGRSITLEMTRTGDSAPDWLRPATRLHFLDPMVFDRAGQRCPVISQERDWFGRTARLKLLATKPPPDPAVTIGPPHKLVMEIPTEVIEYDVRLEFTDVVLH